MFVKFVKENLIVILFFTLLCAGFLRVEYQLNNISSEISKALDAQHAIQPPQTDLKPSFVHSEQSNTVIPQHSALIDDIEYTAGMRLSGVVEVIMKHEGKRTRPYLDTQNKVTIGYGRSLQTNGISITEYKAIVRNGDYHTLLSYARVHKGRIYVDTIAHANKLFPLPLTDHDVALLLTDDLHNVKHEAVGVFGDALWEVIDEPRKEVIIDTLFNLGLPNFKEFEHFIAAVKVKDWAEAAEQLLLSQAAKQNVIRWHTNAAVMRTGNRKLFDL